MNNHLQYREDGSIDLVWFNTLSNEDQIILGGFWTEQQWLNYKVKKFELSKEEILGDDIENYIEDCIETDKLEKSKFNEVNYFIGRRENGDLILVSPYFDDFYKRIRHLYLEVDGDSVCENFSYVDWYEEYNFKKISKEEYSKLYGIYSNCFEKIIEVLEKDSTPFHRKFKEGDYIWSKYGDVIQINEIDPERNEYSYNGYHVDGIGFYLGEGEDKVINIVSSNMLNTREEETNILITEESFICGFKLALKGLFEMRKNFNELLDEKI